MKFGFGPMSSESIEAVYKYSMLYKKSLMLIASKNQIDHNGGYVNNWSTHQYMEFIDSMRKKYPAASVLLCRDHCGPGFNGNYDLQDTYKTIATDLECGFDMMHIDFCHYQGADKLSEMKAAILFCQKLRPDIKLEIGTDENRGDVYNDHSLPDIEREVNYFLEFCQPAYYVVQTGSLIKKYQQQGSFNKAFSSKVSSFLKTKNIGLKEHNADYLDNNQIKERIDIVSAMNIAPQFGVLQTASLINQAFIYGVDIKDFVELCYSNRKWEKWFYPEEHVSPLEATMVAGHYHFSSAAYNNIVESLNKVIDIKDIFVNKIMEVIHHYETSSKTLGP